MIDTEIRDRTLYIIFFALLLMIFCALAIVAFFIFFSGDLPWAQTETPQAADAVWLRIQNNQKMIVGVSADYPPFTYVGSDFSLQGYDIDLAQNLGQALKIPVEYKNMAFDGLMNALLLNQIDIAIAAISVTAERDQYVDFSNVYYIGEDAILGHLDSQIQVNTLVDLINYRIGVQRGSIYEDWLRDELVIPGMMPPQNLMSFDTMSAALEAFIRTEGQVDLVVLDLQPAEIAAQSLPVKIVARGFNPQKLAIALPQGAYALQQRINQSLVDLANQGILTALAKQYLSIDNPAPLPTPEPTQIPITPSVCIDGMRFVQDLTFPDFNMTNPALVQPGQNVQKGWRIQNSGQCTWDIRYTLSYVGSVPLNAPVGGSPVAIQGQVAPGQTYDVYANITAPFSPGRFQSFWNLFNPAGQAFGEKLWAGISVSGPTPPTPEPQPPFISRFSADPQQITLGNCLTLDWQYSGGAILYSRIFRDQKLILYDLPAAGTSLDCPTTPTTTGQIQYQMVIDGLAGGSVSATQMVTVFPPLLPTLQPMPTSEQPPQINSFIANPAQIVQGACFDLSWSYSGNNLINADLFRNDVTINDNPSPSGAQSDCPSEPGQYIYLLQVNSASAGSAQASQFVNVVPIIPLNPNP